MRTLVSIGLVACGQSRVREPGSLDKSMTNCVHGVVRSAADSTPIHYANAILIGSKLGAMTDRDGYFVIDDVQPGVYRLQVMAMGYKNVTVDRVTVDAHPGCGKLIEVELDKRTPEPQVPME